MPGGSLKQKITDIVEPNKRYLLTIITKLFDMLLRNVQQQLNNADRKLDNVVK